MNHLKFGLWFNVELYHESYISMSFCLPILCHFTIKTEKIIQMSMAFRNAVMF